MMKHPRAYNSRKIHNAGAHRTQESVTCLEVTAFASVSLPASDPLTNFINYY